MERSPVGESGSADANVLLQAEVFDLVLDSGLFPIVRSLGLVGFDAPVIKRPRLYLAIVETIEALVCTECNEACIS